MAFDGALVLSCYFDPPPPPSQVSQSRCKIGVGYQLFFIL